MSKKLNESKMLKKLKISKMSKKLTKSEFANYAQNVQKTAVSKFIT